MSAASARGKRRLWLYLGLALLVVIGGGATVLLVGLTQSFSRELDDPQYIARYFPADSVTRRSFEAGGRTMHYVRLPNGGGAPVLLIHGSPGSWRDYRRYLQDVELRRRADLIVPDRPGFGNTGGQAETSLERQAELLGPLLELRPDQPFVLVGYSLGGPLAVRLAAGHPGRVRALLLIAPSIDPRLEERRWYNWLAAVPPMPSLLPSVLVASNREIWPLRGELEALEPLWSTITVPVVVVHGETDGLVPPANADYAREMLHQSRILRVPEVGHFILWQETGLILEALLELIPARPDGPRTGPGPAR